MRIDRPGKVSFAVLQWWADRSKEFPFAAFAYRRLRFKHVNRLMGEKVPAEVVNKEWRIYLFRTRDQRDDFIEEFHRDYDAHGKQWQ